METVSLAGILRAIPESDPNAFWIHKGADEITKNQADIFYAKNLLDTALYFLQARTGHVYDCPRSRDDFDCTCGLSDLKHSIKEFLK